MESPREIAIPPPMPAKRRAAGRLSPPRAVVGIEHNTQTAINDLGERGEDDVVAGIKRERKVERWTPNAYPRANPPTPPPSLQLNLRFLVFPLNVPGSEEYSSDGGNERVRSRVRNEPAKISREEIRSKGSV